MRCAVYNCKNCNKYKTDKKISFFTFPRDQKRLEMWVQFCRRKTKFNVDNYRVCSDHFKEEDFQRNLAFEFGISKTDIRRLNPGADPSVYTEPKSIEYLLVEDVDSLDTETELTDYDPLEIDVASDNTEDTDLIKKLKEENLKLKEQNNTLIAKNSQLEMREKITQKKIQSLKAQLTKLKRNNIY